MILLWWDTISPMESRIFYVYVMFRPWDGSPFYVGKGKGARWKQHEWLTKRHYNPRMDQIIRRSRSEGLEIPKVKIREHLTESDAFDIEAAFIAAIGRGTRGPLVNFTDGGEGASGRKLSAASKRLLSEKHTGKKLSQQHIENMRKSRTGYRASDKAKAKISKSLIGNKRSVGRIHSKETRAKMSASHMGNKSAAGKKMTLDERAAHSARIAAWWAARKATSQ
jgi:hypothetical protein